MTVLCEQGLVAGGDPCLHPNMAARPQDSPRPMQATLQAWCEWGAHLPVRPEARG